MTVAEFFDHIYVPNRLLGSGPLTIEQYRVNIHIASSSLGKEVHLADLRPETMVAIVRHLQSKGRSSSTINRCLRHVGAIWRYAHKNGFSHTSPSATKIPEPTRIKMAWTVDEVTMILKSSSEEQGLIGSVSASKWWKAFILAIYDTGVRKRAMIHVPSRNFFRVERAILVPGEFQKNKREQWCPISSQAVEAISDIEPSGMLFPWPWDSSPMSRYVVLNTRFKTIIRRAGLTTDGGLFHRLRRTRASYGEAASPGSATKDLGHSSREVTERYLDPRITGVHRTVDLIPRP